MNTRTHAELANFIWRICNLLRGPYKRNEYRKVILPLTVLRRFDCVLAPTKEAVLVANSKYSGQSENVRSSLLEQASGLPFYNTSKLDFQRLLDDPNYIAQNLGAYIRNFSPNVREIMERFAFAEHIVRMAEKNLLFRVVQQFAAVDLSPDRIDNVQMGYVFEELIRVGAEQANEEAGEHFTPREVIRLMVSLLLSPEPELGRSHVVKTIYDPACGTGGMLSVAEEFLLELNRESNPILYGQDWNDEAWAVCKSDMLIKGANADNIILGDTFTEDGYERRRDGTKCTFDYMLANPPFGVEWKQQQHAIEREHDSLGHQGRFGAGLPYVKDGALLFLQHMLSKMEPVTVSGEGGSRLAIVFNGSPLFTGDAESGVSTIRQWILENDWLEAIVALPDQLFYNTGISTYVWVLTNRKEPRRVGKVQLIDGRHCFVKMRKSLGQKRNKIGDPRDNPREPDHIAELTRLHGNFEDGEERDVVVEDPITHQPRTRARIVSKVFSNKDFGYREVTVERPLRMNFAATQQRVTRLEKERVFQNLAKSSKQPGHIHDREVAQGRARQESIRAMLQSIEEATGGNVVQDSEAFKGILRKEEEAAGLRLRVPERNAVLAALGERDAEAEACRNSKGNLEPDPELRDTEIVPLSEDASEYMAREVLPHFPDAWVDENKTKVGYEIPFNLHFHVYEPPRPLEEIEADLHALEHEITELLTEVIV